MTIDQQAREVDGKPLKRQVWVMVNGHKFQRTMYSHNDSAEFRQRVMEAMDGAFASCLTDGPGDYQVSIGLGGRVKP